MNVVRAVEQIKATYRTFVMTQGERGVRRLERAIANASLVGDRPFFDTQQFPWVATLEANWQTIRQELDRILEHVEALPNFQDISADQYAITQDNRWKTYFFYAYGIKSERNCANCPATTQLIEQIPEMKTAFFSILLPHKDIPEHRGPYKGLLRYHLALRVPQTMNHCAIKVGDEVRQWQAGKSLIFDDTFPHSAWNHTDEIRVILFLDFVRPLKFPFSLFNRWMIQLITWSPLVQSGKDAYNAWDQRIEKILNS
jgi:ornithine lipid ester-linked acyl 2-hydroxylase